MPPEEQKTFSLDYPRLAQEVLQATLKEATCKLPAGLYIVGTPIGHLGDITLRALATLALADSIACEDTRVSGGMLSRYGLKKQLLPYHDHNADAAGNKIIAALQRGESVALISDAGMPLVSDPGYDLVRQARAAGLPVTVIPGPSAALTALAGAGLPSDQFHFAGFLSSKSAARIKDIAALAAVPGTLLIYESPQRLAGSLRDLAAVLGPRPAAVARELTKLFEEFRGGTLNELAAHYATHDVKGEIVILVAPATGAATPTSAADIEAQLREALKTSSLRDAVQRVSLTTGAKKKEVYDLALKIEKDTGATKGSRT